MIQAPPSGTRTEPLDVVKRIAVGAIPFFFWTFREKNRRSYGIYDLAQTFCFTGKAFEVIGTFFCLLQGNVINLVFHNDWPRLCEPVAGPWLTAFLNIIFIS